MRFAAALLALASLVRPSFADGEPRSADDLRNALASEKRVEVAWALYDAVETHIEDEPPSK